MNNTARKQWLTLVCGIFTIVALAACLPSAYSATPTLEEAWQALPTYEHGQDLDWQQVLGQEIQRSMQPPERRSAFAAKLAAVLTDPKSTLAAKQNACFMLGQIGTAAEVPALAKLLRDPNTKAFEMARYSLTQIVGPEASAVLVESLGWAKGKSLVSIIGSLAARNETKSDKKMIELLASKDPAIVQAATLALCKFATADSESALLAELKKVDSTPAPAALEEALLMIAAKRLESGKKGSAQAILEQLAKPTRAMAVRRGAMIQLVSIDPKTATAKITKWLASDDPLKQTVAKAALGQLPVEAVVSIAKELSSLPVEIRITLIRNLCQRDHPMGNRLAQAAAMSENPKLRLAGISSIQTCDDPKLMPVLVDLALEGGELGASAKRSLLTLPNDLTGPFLLEDLRTEEGDQAALLDLIGDIRARCAIDYLVQQAGNSDMAVSSPVIQALTKICSPDHADLARLFSLHTKTEPGKHREAVDRAILIVCSKKSDSDWGKTLDPYYDAKEKADLARLLPLLGRLGGKTTKGLIDKSLGSDDPAIQTAALRGLCNWPDATIAEQLGQLAKSLPSEKQHRWALRAYIRLIPLDTNRAPQQTLDMFKNAMQLATVDADRCYVIKRCANLRTIAALEWIASFTDQPAIEQAAYGSIVELAHHKFLRDPNRQIFAPLLKKVAEKSKDANLKNRASRYLLGL
jgi:hypothetical protein